jgi:hypothetical protein
VRTDAAGRRRVTCPQCRRAEVEVPRGATVAVVLRCPMCHGPFLVGLDPSAPEPTPAAPPAPDVIIDADGRLWDYCPKCGYAALSPTRIGTAFALTCGVCGQEIIVNHGPAPPDSVPLSIWERIRKWFRGG